MNFNIKYRIWHETYIKNLLSPMFILHIIYLISAIGGPFLVMEFSTSLARRDPIILKINLRQCSSKYMLVLWSPRWPLVAFSIHSKSLKLLIQLQQFFTNFQNHKGALDKTSGLLRWGPHCWICEVLKRAEFFTSLAESVQILVCLIWSLLVVDVLYWFAITKLMSWPSMTLIHSLMQAMQLLWRLCQPSIRLKPFINGNIKSYWWFHCQNLILMIILYPTHPHP